MALKTKKSADADIATTVRDILNAGKEDSKKVAEEVKKETEKVKMATTKAVAETKAKAKAKDMVEEVYNRFVANGELLGNRRLFLEYVWESCIVPQLGYAFSEPHLAGYTMILAQEMNLARMSPLHWKVACLCVNSGDINEDVSGSTDYGAIAKAIAGMEKGFVVIMILFLKLVK